MENHALEVGGQRRGKFGKFSHSGRVTSKLSTCITIPVKLAPPTLGAWSMAGLLGQPLEYYYYYLNESMGGVSVSCIHRHGQLGWLPHQPQQKPVHA